MRAYKRNPRYYGPGGWKGRETVLRLVRERAASGEVCAICGTPIDVFAPQWVIEDGKRKRAPWSLECDEIVPISRGGSPTDPDNVRPTHRICNQRRGAGKDGERVTAPQAPHDTRDGSTGSRW